MALKMRLCIKKAFCVLKVTIYNGGQMTAWPVFARCNGGQKTVSPKQNGLLTTGHRSNRWSRGRWSEGGTPVVVGEAAMFCKGISPLGEKQSTD